MDRLPEPYQRMFIGWIRRERDICLAIASLSRSISLPQQSGTAEMARDDLGLLERFRAGLSSEGHLNLDENDRQILVDIGRSNKIPDKREFWDTVVKVLENNNGDSTDRSHN